MIKGDLQILTSTKLKVLNLKGILAFCKVFYDIDRSFTEKLDNYNEAAMNLLHWLKNLLFFLSKSILFRKSEIFLQNPFQNDHDISLVELKSMYTLIKPLKLSIIG